MRKREREFPDVTFYAAYLELGIVRIKNIF